MYSLIIGPLLFRIDPEGWQSYIRSFSCKLKYTSYICR